MMIAIPIYLCFKESGSMDLLILDFFRLAQDAQDSYARLAEAT